MEETLLVTETDTSQFNGLGLLSCTPPLSPINFELSLPDTLTETLLYVPADYFPFIFIKVCCS